MTKKKSIRAPFQVRLGKAKHEHRLQPVEYGHPVTVTDSDIPEGLTTENVAIVEMSGGRFNSLSGDDFPIGDWQAAFSLVRDRHGDCFDFVIFFTDPGLPRIGFSGYHRGVYNEIAGINRGFYNRRYGWGSERLQSQVWMGRFSLGTLLQEIGHRWGSFVRYRQTRTGANQSDLLLPGGGHWAREFDDGDSPMDYDEERHVRIAPTRWRREPIGGFEFRYCPLDLYIMGLMNPGEVGRFTLIRNYREIGAPLPGGRRIIQGNARNLTTTNVIWAEGQRVPSRPDSQTNFKAAFVVVTRDATNLDQQFVKKVEVLRRQCESYFQLACKNRACMDTRLCCGHTISRRGTIKMNLKKDKITWSPFLYHGLGPVPAKVEVGLETSIGGEPIDAWSREETPDIKTGVQHLSAQVNRDPYDGQFRIVGQAKGSNLNISVKWWASSIL